MRPFGGWRDIFPCRDAGKAEDVTQLVFTDLARKAAVLARHQVLAGWLFTSTRYAASKAVRSERRRQAREQQAQLMQENSPDDSVPALDWQRARGVIDEVLAELNAPDREAVLLRFSKAGNLPTSAQNCSSAKTPRACAWTAPSTNCASASSGATTSIFAFMSMPKLQFVCASAVLVTGAGSYAVQNQTQAGLRAKPSALQREQPAIELTAAKNQRLAKNAAEADALRQDDTELARLKEEAAALLAHSQARARLAAANATDAGLSSPVFPVEEVDQKPKATSQPRPIYPFEMCRSGTPGSALLSFIVDAEGRVYDVKAVKSTHPDFAGAAIKAVSQWEFQPGQKGGKNVNTRMLVPIGFTVAEGSNRQRNLSEWF